MKIFPENERFNYLSHSLFIPQLRSPKFPVAKIPHIFIKKRTLIKLSGYNTYLEDCYEAILKIVIAKNDALIHLSVRGAKRIVYKLPGLRKCSVNRRPNSPIINDATAV